MDWVKQVRSLNVDISTGKRAPYKQLLLLWMIGRVIGGESAKISFQEAEKPLEELMTKFRLGERAEPKLPFVHLAANPELWTVEDSEGSNVYEMGNDQRRKITFLREGVAGELSAEFAAALTEPKILESVVTAVLHTDFPETTHQGILDEVNLSGHVLPINAVRDPHFRKSVMLAYEFRCAFCGYDGRINSRPVGIEAAHVKMHSKGGPDDVSNGIALCSLHHLLFDSGVLSLSDERVVLVSQYFLESGHGTAPSVMELIGQPMRHPQSGYGLPAAEFLRWHRENLFTEPARS